MFKYQKIKKELTDRLTEILTDEGITIKTNVQVKSARKEGDKKVLVYSLEEKEEEVSADEILLAVGKTPNTEGLHLDKAGVALLIHNLQESDLPRKNK